MKINELNIKTKDNFDLEVSHYIPDVSKQNVVLVNAALAVEKKYYDKFACFLTTQGFDVYLYNYRGIGKTKPSSWKNCKISLNDWIENDFDAMLDYVLNNHSNYKKTLIGHSLGGQMIGANEKINQFQSAILIASGIGYWKNWNFPVNLQMLNYFYVAFPILSHFFGYFPFSKLGGGEDLPKKVALEWAKWCRSKNYLFDFLPQNTLQNYKKLKIPLLHYSFTDDTYCPRRVALALQKFYPAHTEDKHVSPQSINEKSIGHFGFFKQKFEKTLWKDLLNWIEK
ncbi:MAG: alpha/beta fold hydrolase [Bacteroidetes bacterium]|nr:MAG: alpha/beta fold hydrolase [Bacteroidota bacterium]TAG85676.1 MAG: alpha/beta fold hydrolase [Bacteroidota bacterium]